ncbi:MAG: heme-binding beta-barrel domain-containing protein [Acidocella sp.]|nr:heme-binding beta-barrel domain-containing protein [Acidocella sp.]
MSYLTKSIFKTAIFAAALIAPITVPYGKALAATPEADTVIGGLDYGPLAELVGTWKTDTAGGVDIAPGRADSTVGEGGVAVSPYYETMTFSPAGDATNASDQHLAAMFYRQQVFRKSDNKQFHDQIGYLIYDKKNQMVYDTFCIPRAVCVVAEGKPGTTLALKSEGQGIAQSQYMVKNDNTGNFTITYEISKNTLKYKQETNLQVYGKPFSHIDSGTLTKAGN